MKKSFALLTMLLSGFVIAACGISGDDADVTPEGLAAAMDTVCSDAQADFDAMGVRGLTNPQLALEFEGTAEVRQSIVDGFNDLNLNEEAKAEIEPYLTASEKVIASDKAIAEAAAADNTEAVNKAFAEQGDAVNERDEAAKKIGTEVCGQFVEIKLSDSGTAPPDDLDLSEPVNGIENSVEGYLAAAKTGNCKAINRMRHSDAGQLGPDECEAVAESLKGATIARTESYGPVAVAELVSGNGTHFVTAFVLDQDQELRYSSDAIHDSGGLRPAPEDNDSQEAIDATVAAIRDNDGAAFNETLPDGSSGFWLKDEGEFDTFSDGEYNKTFVRDVRDSDAEPVQLGLNAAFGFYLLEGSENDWVLTTIHNPGTGSHYRFSGYWPVPKP